MRAIRSALLARLPLLVGLRRLDLLLADLLLVDAFALPAFDLAELDSPVLPLAVFVPLDVDVFFLLEVECRAAGFWSSEDCPATGNATITKVSAAATHRIARETMGCWREVALIISLYLYLCLLDA